MVAYSVPKACWLSFFFPPAFPAGLITGKQVEIGTHGGERNKRKTDVGIESLLIDVELFGI